jgi:trans-aconitate methyltransferase
VDLSPVAISMATEKYGGKKVEFEVADILEYQCRRNYDVILFSESFNYIKDPDQKGLLDRLCQNLNPGGCIIVTLSNPDRYQAIINLINRNFEVLKEGKFKDSNRYITIFKKRAVDK